MLHKFDLAQDGNFKKMRNHILRILLTLFIVLFIAPTLPSVALSADDLEARLETSFYYAKKYAADEDVMKHLEVDNMNRDPAFLIEDKEKLTVINFWAPWCSGCVTELPTLKRFQEQNQDVRVIYVAENRSGFPAVKKMADEMGLPVENSFYDSRGYIKRWLDANVFPTTIVVSPNGQFLYRFEGDTDWSKPLMAEAIKSMKNR